MKTCVSIRQKRQEEALKSLQKVKGKVHLAEIWLDQIQDLDLNSLLKKAPLPLLITYKRPVDGGAFQGDWKAMAGGLLEAIKFGVDYVDIPLEMPKELNKKIVQSSPKSNTKIIASYHDFSSTPGLLPLQKLAQELADRGGDILKIATQVTCDEDVLNLMSLALDFKKEGIEHIIIGMGEKGRVTRVMAEELGNVINFVALSQKEARWGQGWVEEF